MSPTCAPALARPLRWRKRVFSLAFMSALLFLSATQSSPQDSTPSGTAAPSRAAGQEQRQRQGPVPQAAPVPLRASTHLVQVNVIVQDKKGNPVTDLSKSDFEIFDQGKPQSISFFSLESTHLQPTSSTPPPLNVYSNRIDKKPGVPTSVTVILIDLLNTHFSDMAYARQQLVKFLKNLQPEDRVALYGLTTHLTVLHDFTSNAASLLETLNRTHNVETPQAAASEFQPSNVGDGVPDAFSDPVTQSSTADPTAAPAINEPDTLDAFLDKANQQIADFYTTNRAYTTAKALESIAAHIAPLPGRKNLIWISSGFPIDIGMEELDINSTRDTRSFSDEVERAARALSDSNTAIYPVDARGLIGMPSTMTAQSRGPSPRANVTLSALVPNQKIFDTMNILADRTGGRAYFNTNNIQGSIRRAIDDSRVTYVLGYYPDHGQWNGKFREIKIKVNRPGTDIRYRRGYFALGDEAPVDEKTDEVLLRASVDSPIDASTLGMTVTVKAVDVPGALTLNSTVNLESRDFVLNQKGGQWVGALDFLFIQMNDHDKVINLDARRITLNLPQNTYEKIAQDGLILPWNLRIASDARELRMVVRDSLSESTGSVTIPLRSLFPSLHGN